MKNKLMAFACGLGLCLGASSVAFAAETANHPGSACFATSNNAAEVTSAGEVSNPNSATTTFICPVERTVGTPVTHRYLSGRVFVKDRHPWFNVCCRSRSRNPSGSNKMSAWQCSNGSSSSYKILDTAQIYDPATWSHFYLECTVPAPYSGNKSQILTYRGIQN